MDSILPVATSSATQTVFITSTGIEKAMVLVGFGTILLLAVIGLVAIVKAVYKNNIGIKKIG